MAEAAARLVRDGPSTLAEKRHRHGVKLLMAQFTSPIILILVAATATSMALATSWTG